MSDLVGQQFGSWTVIQKTDIRVSDRPTYLCQCTCGTSSYIPGKELTRAQGTKSCHSCTDRAGKNSRWTGYGEISGEFWSRIKAAAVKRELDFAITIEHAWDLFLQQKNKCALSDLPLYFAPRRNQRNDGVASLDRIDSTQGYVVGNIQWVHKHINKLKTDFSEDVFKELCGHVRAVEQPTNTVMVSGGWDPFHHAHYDHIKAASQYGRVVVAVNSDAWLFRKKGYVFMPWEERAKIMGAIREVFMVIDVDDTDGTAIEAIRRIQPTHFANGGDRQKHNVPEQAICDELGVEMLWGVGGEDKPQSSSWLVNNAMEQLRERSNDN